MILNGEDNSLKGHVFDAEIPDSIPSFILKKSMDEQIAWAEKETARYEIVTRCPVCDEPLISEEVVAHADKHVSTKVRPLFRTARTLSADERAELASLLKVVV